MSKQKVIIMSGLPGSGKSTKASECGGYVVSADDYFMKDGVYQFDPTKLSDAHRKCLTKFIWAIEVDSEIWDIPNSIPIIVDNTNTTIEEISVYYKLADVYGYDVTLITMICDPEVAFKRNTHGTPLKTIQRMHHNLQHRVIPKYWNIKQESFSYE